jgi:glycosyltransferase involved in cell wall biosynthesis
MTSITPTTAPWGALPVLFIGHDASRAGAPIALLHFMHWYQANIGGPISCLLIRGGDLEQEFRAICQTTVMENDGWQPRSIRRRIMKKAGLDGIGRQLHARSVAPRNLKNYRLIFYNTLDTSEALELPYSSESRFLCYVHELETCIRTYIGLREARRILDRGDRVVACSNATAENLIRNHGLHREKVDVVHESVLVSALAGKAQEENRQWLRTKLNVGANSIIVGGCGRLGWIKGSDLFVQMAAVVTSMAPEIAIHYVWLGGSPESEEGVKFEHDVRKCGLENRITLISSQPDPMRYFQAMDVFVLTSREDPYPLVCLEAAACAIPIICFDGAGGMPEFVQSDCGRIVPYLDIRGLATAVASFARDSERRRQTGANARTKVMERHDIGVIGPQLLRAMQNAMEASPI